MSTYRDASMISKTKKKPFKDRYKNEIKAYTMLSYPLLHWGVFFVLAMLFTFLMSFMKWDIMTPPRFVGLQNYIKIICDDEVFWKALKNTCIWAISSAIIPVAIGLFIAFLLSSVKRLTVLFRTALYWPALVSITAIINIQKIIFLSTPTSIANRILTIFFGLDAVAWFDDPNIALFSLMIWPIFLGFPQAMLFFIAGLKQIPSVYYEVAKIDGARPYTVFFKITLPLLKPIVFLNMVLGLINGFRVIAPMQLITRGGPANATTSLVYRIYIEGFQFLKMGYSSAMSIILLIIVLAFTAIQYRLQGEQISYS